MRLDQKHLNSLRNKVDVKDYDEKSIAASTLSKAWNSLTAKVQRNNSIVSRKEFENVTTRSIAFSKAS